MKHRFATLPEIPLIVDLAREEHAQSKWADDRTPFNPDKVARTAEEFITTMGRTLLLSDGGYLFGMVQPMGFSNQLIAIEYAWYARDGKGMGLLESFEWWGQAMGATQIVVHDHVTNGRLSKVLERRRNYKSIGTTLIRNTGELHAQAA